MRSRASHARPRSASDDPVALSCLATAHRQRPLIQRFDMPAHHETSAVPRPAAVHARDGDAVEMQPLGHSPPTSAPQPPIRRRANPTSVKIVKHAVGTVGSVGGAVTAAALNATKGWTPVCSSIGPTQSCVANLNPTGYGTIGFGAVAAFSAVGFGYMLHHHISQRRRELGGASSSSAPSELSTQLLGLVNLSTMRAIAEAASRRSACQRIDFA